MSKSEIVAAHDIVAAQVKYSTETEEYRVLAFIAHPKGGIKRHPAADYFTSDLDDAYNTAKVMVKELPLPRFDLIGHRVRIASSEWMPETIGYTGVIVGISVFSPAVREWGLVVELEDRSLANRTRTYYKGSLEDLSTL